MLIFFTISKNENLKERFYNQTFKNLVHHNYDIKKFFRFSTYGVHYDTAIQIFKNHPYFGVGLKNYRIESGKAKYENPNFIFNEKRKTTHPHQVHCEFLAEMGLFGYISFLISRISIQCTSNTATVDGMSTLYLVLLMDGMSMMYF